MTKPLRIYPVIHHIDRKTSLEQVSLAKACEADGVFLICHPMGQDADQSGDEDLLGVAYEAQRVNQGFPIGINMLSLPATKAAPKALAAGLSMLWADNMGVDSAGLNGEGIAMRNFATQHPNLKCFAGVAFKYQRREPNPELAAQNAESAGFVPTTSGPGTGTAPKLEKIKAMSRNRTLAVASGITPDNVATFAPYLGHILVATGISLYEHRIDESKLRLLIQNCAPWR